MIWRYFLRWTFQKNSTLEVTPAAGAWKKILINVLSWHHVIWRFFLGFLDFFFQFREDVIIGHLHQTLRDQDRLRKGDPGRVTALWPPAGHDPGGLTPPLTKIVLHLRNLQELGRLKTGILHQSSSISIHELIGISWNQNMVPNQSWNTFKLDFWSLDKVV